MSAVPQRSTVTQLKDQLITERQRDVAPELTRRLRADLAADAAKIDQKVRTAFYDDAFAIVSLSCLVIAGAVAFYVLFGM